MRDESTIVSLSDLEYDVFKDSNHVFTDRDVYNDDNRTEGTVLVNQSSV
jgi:hypothetical protein